MKRMAILMVFLTLPTILLAQARKPIYAKIRLTKGRASDVKALIYALSGEWWKPNGRLPDLEEAPILLPGIQSITAYDVDNTLIVRYQSEEALQALEQQIKTVNIPLVALLLEIYPVPVFRKGFKEIATTDSFWKTLTKDVVVRSGATNNLSTFFRIGPNAFGEQYPSNPMSGFHPTLETSILVTPHIIQDDSIAFLCNFRYRDGDHKTRTVTKVVWGKLNKRAVIVFPIDDTRHPVAAYRLGITARFENKPPETTIERRLPDFNPDFLTLSPP